MQQYSENIDIHHQQDCLAPYYQITPFISQIMEHIRSPLASSNKAFSVVFPSCCPCSSFTNQLVKHLESFGQPQDIVIPFFTTSSSTSDYCYALYHFILHLRRALDVEQKVELIDEKLRKYFPYYLDICNTIMKQQVNKVSRIILIIEGVDRFQQGESNKQDSLSLWLPQCFPDQVRVILTSQEDSPAHTYLLSHGSPTLIIPSHLPPHPNPHSSGETQDILLELTECKADEDYLRLYQAIYMKDTLQLYAKWNTGPHCKSYIDQLSSTFKPDRNRILLLKMEHLINDIIEECNKVVSKEKVLILLQALSVVERGLSLVELQTIIKISMAELEVLIVLLDPLCISHSQVIRIKEDMLSHLILSDKTIVIDKVIQALQQGNVSLRKLQEQSQLLFKDKQYFRLKEVVADVEAFLLLFIPDSKFQFCRYWQKLEEIGFDPVLEYNKSVEQFETHFRPKSEDMFKILFQLSRFFREFADFETRYTPKFRHPPVKGSKELQEVGLSEELMNMSMEAQEEEETNILTSAEALNIDIPSNYHQARQLAQIQLQDILEGQKIGEVELNVQDNIQYYYYKRWLWVIFPVVCISQQRNYSQLVKECYQTDILYMTVNKEHKLYIQALKAALHNKINKKQMYANKGDVQLEEQINILDQMDKEILHLESKQKPRVDYNSVHFNKKAKKIQKDLDTYYQRNHTEPDHPLQNCNPVPTLFTEHKQSNYLNASELFLTSTLPSFEESFLPALKNHKKKPNCSQLNTTVLLQKSRIQKENLKGYQVDTKFIAKKTNQSIRLLPKLQYNINNHTNDEIKLMDHQQKIYCSQFNKIKYQNQQLQKTLQVLQNQSVGNTGKDYSSNKLIYSQKISQLEQKCQQLHNSFISAEEQKKRMNKIIDICKINKNQNEDWITVNIKQQQQQQQLSHLLQSKKKMIQKEQAIIKEDQEDISQMQKINLDLIDEYKRRNKNHQQMVEYIKMSLVNKVQIDKKFLLSDTLTEQQVNQEILKLSHGERKKNEQEQNIYKQTQNVKNLGVQTKQKQQFEKEKEKLEEVLKIDIEQIFTSKGWLNYLEGKNQQRDHKRFKLEQEYEIKTLKATKKELEKELMQYQKEGRSSTPMEEEKQLTKEEYDILLSRMNNTNEDSNRKLKNSIQISLKAVMSINALLNKLKIGEQAQNLKSIDYVTIIDAMTNKINCLITTLGQNKITLFLNDQLSTQQILTGH